MTWLRTLLAALFASMARTESQTESVARLREQLSEKRTVTVPKPPRYYREAKARIVAESMPLQPPCVTEDPLTPPAQEIAP